MQFSLLQSISILERTPAVLTSLLQNLDEEWTSKNEGSNTWSPFDVLGHLIHGEKTDWIPRMEIFLSDSPHKTFQPFDMHAQFEESKGKNLDQLLMEFSKLRLENLKRLTEKDLTEEDLSRQAIHPELGSVTLRQHLSTWTVHDLGHIAQISRVMAKQYSTEVGPWKVYLGILK